MKVLKHTSNHKVGNTLFRVPKNGFQVPGTIFEAMFSLPTNEAKAIIEGSNDDNPIHLHGIDETKFRAFLTILYPSYVSLVSLLGNLPSDYSASKEVIVDEESQYRTLVGALDLATFWEFTKVSLCYYIRVCRISTEIRSDNIFKHCSYEKRS